MASVTFTCQHETTIATVCGHFMTLIVTDDAGGTVYRKAHTIWGESWDELHNVPTTFEPYHSGFSAALDWAKRAADGITN